jgi:predicted DNA-binding antitoxin AbrB/MazE fold protein
MTTKVDAVYENGTLRLPGPLPLPEKTRVWVTIQTGREEVPAEPDLTAWLKLSEQALTTAWDNPDDDVFNALLAK